VLFLDEPTSGLNPVTTRDVHELIAELRRSGVTIFLTTHRLEEAERLCDRVAILNTTLRTIGRPAELRDRLFGQDAHGQDPRPPPGARPRLRRPPSRRRQALTSIRRVLKPGGRFAAVVFSAPGRCPYLSLPHAIVFRIGRFTSPAPERFGEFRLGAPGVLQDAFGTAGFREISVHAVPARRRFPSLAEAMQYARGPLPLRELMARLSRADQEQAWAEIERALAQFVGPQGYDSPCELLIGVGTK